MISCVFPGQGSQHVGMQEELLNEYSSYVVDASNHLGYDLHELCTKDEQQNLNNTKYTQVALYVVNFLSYLKFQKEYSCDYVAGHSLGEYNALLAAGAFSFMDGLKLVERRGLIMSKISNGSMAAVLGLDSSDISKILEDNNLDLDVANFNSTKQTVIAGLEENIAKAEEVFLQNKARRYVILPVSGAFHSRYMTEAKEEFKSFVDQFSFLPLQKTVISNKTAREYTNENLKENLTSQIDSSVRWVESILYLLSKDQEMEFIECGPKNVLTSLIAKIKQGK